jgi:hypothetical protein
VDLDDLGTRAGFVVRLTFALFEGRESRSARRASRAAARGWAGRVRVFGVLAGLGRRVAGSLSDHPGGLECLAGGGRPVTSNGVRSGRGP